MMMSPTVRGAVLCACLLWSCAAIAAGGVQVKAGKTMQSDKRPDAVPAHLEMTIEHPYLHLPVKNGGPKCRMRFAAGDETLREFEIELAGAEPDFWVFSDVSALKGRRITIHVGSLPEGSKGLGAIVQADAVPAAANQMYREKLRPQFHFSSRRGWNNDPNGLVYHAGEYHLYYQHNPYGWKWGNMHWGHAVSTDLVHWKELPVAIYPHKFGDWAFSGSAAVDADNTAGFKKGREDVIVAAYTSTGRGECIAYSNDRGRTFIDFEGNPVVKHGGRDPKIIWYAPGKHWVMAVFDESKENGANVAFYTSKDLKEWEVQSHLKGYFECPEIFELPVDGDENNTRWVVFAADARYAIGKFDGKIFTPAHEGKHRVHYGSYYASQTFSNPPDGRRIQIGWAQLAMPGMPFNQAFTFPHRLTLRTTPDGIRMFAEPIKEIAKLRKTTHTVGSADLAPDAPKTVATSGELFEIRAEFAVGQAKAVGLDIGGNRVTFDVASSKLNGADMKPVAGKVTMQVIVDRPMIEICGNDGAVYITSGRGKRGDVSAIKAFGEGGSAKLLDLKVHELNSIWRDVP